MIRLPSRIHIGRLAVAFVAAVVLVGFVESVLADETSHPVGSSNEAKNLARMICGAQIECITPNGTVTRASSRLSQDAATAALIMEDQTVSRALEQGETTYILTLPRISLLNRFSFRNENADARGDVTISVSDYRLPARSSRWNEAAPAISFSGQRVFNLSLPGIEAKYVRLSFRVEKEGRIAALGLYGTETLERFGARQGEISDTTNDVRSVRLKHPINFNFANLYARAEVVYVSSGPIPGAARMIDDDGSTWFSFSAADPHPTVIVELAGSPRLNRASAVYKMQSGRLDIYLLDNFPAHPGNLGDLTPIASITDVNANGKAAADFDVRTARYVALRWTPDRQHNLQNGFEVAEIGAFGIVPLAVLQVSEAPIVYVENTQVGVIGPTDPPAVPPVSP